VNAYAKFDFVCYNFGGKQSDSCPFVKINNWNVSTEEAIKDSEKYPFPDWMVKEILGEKTNESLH
jgi:hypothetical protein